MRKSREIFSTIYDFVFLGFILFFFIGLVTIRDSDLLLQVNARLLHSTINLASLVVCVSLCFFLTYVARPFLGHGNSLFVHNPVISIGSSILLVFLMTVLPVPSSDIDQLDRWPWLWIRYLNVAAIEEFVFRAIIFELLKKSLGTGWSIGFSSVMFALGHYAFIFLGASVEVSFLDFFVKSLIGSVLCTYYLAFGLVPVIVLHAATDVLGNSLGITKQLVFLGFLVLIGIYALLLLKRKRKASHIDNSISR